MEKRLLKVLKGLAEEFGWRAPGAEPAGPLVFEPAVDWSRFAEPNILHAY